MTTYETSNVGGATAPSISMQIAAHANSVRLEDVPASVIERSKHLILDAIGAAFAASSRDYSLRTLAALQTFGTGDSSVIGHRTLLPLRDAVMMNGLLVHGLDYDDTHSRGVLHPSASCFPTALGVAASIDASGRDLLTAYIVGVEAAARLGSVAKGGFHQVGFHPTGVIGTFACSLVAGRLWRLSDRQLTDAQGISLSLASGSLEFLQDGAWTKRLHPGWAGSAGITAAALARAGFVGPRAAYEGRFGLYSSHLGPLAEICDLDLAVQGWGEVWELEDVAVKPFPACHFTHATADAAIALKAAHGFRPEDIVEVKALVPAEVMKTVCEPVANKQRPQNSYDAQFSIPYAAASGLVRGTFGLDDLEPDMLADPVALAVAARVVCEADPGADFPRYYSGELIVTLADGRVIRHREHINRGSSDRPLSNDEVVAKFMSNATLALSEEAADEIRRATLRLDSEPEAAALAKQLSGRASEEE